MFDGREYMDPPILLAQTANINHATVKSSWVDMAGYEGCLFVVEYQALTGQDGSNYITPSLYEHDTTADTGATEVAAADIKGSTLAVVDAASEDECVQYAHYVGAKRYVGVNLTVTSAGSLPTGPVSVFAIPYKKTSRPGSAQTATART